MTHCGSLISEAGQSFQEDHRHPLLQDLLGEDFILNQVWKNPRQHTISGHPQEDPRRGGLKTKSPKCPFISSGSSRMSRRGWGILSSSGGARWVAPASARTSSFSSLKPILQRVKSNKQSTWSGTKFRDASSLDTSLRKGYSKKQLGIGASAGFIGGASYGYGSGLASYSVYHRQKFDSNKPSMPLVVDWFVQVPEIPMVSTTPLLL